MDYRPNNWVIIKFKGDDPHYRVLGGWSGGYLDGSSWRMNSGITRVEESDDNHLKFYGASGSCYEVSKDTYMLKMNNAGVWDQLQEIHGDKVELMDSDTDWFAMDWIISENP